MILYKGSLYILASKDLDETFKEAVEQLTHKKVVKISVTGLNGRYSMTVQFKDGTKSSFTYDEKLPPGGVPYTKYLLED